MHEFITFYQGKWWHFFMKPFYGLCVRKKEGSRFSNFEVLLGEACEDFYAISAGNGIHLVCQNKAGHIVYLFMEQDVWRKTVLLESKEAKAYPKHFRLISVGGFINLFYTILHKDKYLLIHQIITAEDRPPTVVDAVQPSATPFWVQMCNGTDITILYENDKGVSGSRIYRWSRKAFSRFMPIHPAAKCIVKSFWPEADGRMHYAAFQQVEGFYNLVYFRQEQDGSYTEPVTVYLDCPAEVLPVFSRLENTQYLVWQEQGGIFSVRWQAEEERWSKPVRYMIPAGMETVLYHISNGNDVRYGYGYGTGQEIVIYGAEGLAEPKQEPVDSQWKPVGYEVEAFAESMGAGIEAPAASQAPILEQMKEELVRIKEQIFRLRIENKELTERLEAVEEKMRVPLADETVIDEILLLDE